MDLSISHRKRLGERAYLIGIQDARQPAWQAQDSLAELAELADTAGVEEVGRMLVRLRSPHPATWIGSGKVEEIAGHLRACNAEVVLFDEDLSPVQGRNLEQAFGVRVVDRTQVILDIFAQRAHTAEGRLQIELAQLEYLLPRLRHLWTHLERQKGGIGLKGPGEQQIELDRRRVEARIVSIQKQMEGVRARRRELRRGRQRHGWALICLVGYTNAGKTTLLNALTGSAAYADDRLFATLDPTTRKLELPNHQSALMTDTVGFIRKLPHRLVDAFQSTLEEATMADLLVHVVDASHPLAVEQIEAVRGVLMELGAKDPPMVTVLNKCDQAAAQGAARRLAAGIPGSVIISARSGEGLDELRTAIADRLKNRSVPFSVWVPFADGRSVAALRHGARIEVEREEGEGLRIRGRAPPRILGALGEGVTHEPLEP
ncbi:MAG: GTPase HflX [Kiritimatiellae bacterium]|nr:GTPase HflX [Kiritimatiellia bacterium]